MQKDLKRKVAMLNFWASNRSLKLLLFILFMATMVLLHQLGIVVMVSDDAIY